MSLQDSTLTIDELAAAAGGARIGIGPVYINLDKGQVSIGVKDVFDVTVWSDGGICGHVGGNNGRGGCL